MSPHVIGLMNFALGLWLGLALGVFLGMLLFALFEFAKRQESDDFEQRLATRKFFRSFRCPEGNYVSRSPSRDHAHERDREHAKNLIR